MTFRIINALRIISIIVLVLVFFISYAGLPEQVLVLLDNDGNPTQYIDKNYFFYGTLFLLIITNLLFYTLANLLLKGGEVKTQLNGMYILALSAIVNIFFAVTLTFLAIINGQENFDYNSFAPFIYLSLGLFIVWLLAYLFSLAKLKKTV
ncbi:MAG: hypothetical protein L3J06_05795 [Cyclobacteriaceae bacterium]|nr:hypothetical protein [Cyclobacteriaceae bacterium]